MEQGTWVSMGVCSDGSMEFNLVSFTLSRLHVRKENHQLSKLCCKQKPELTEAT